MLLFCLKTVGDADIIKRVGLKQTLPRFMHIVNVIENPT